MSYWCNIDMFAIISDSYQLKLVDVAQRRWNNALEKIKLNKVEYDFFCYWFSFIYDSYIVWKQLQFCFMKS